MLLKKAKFIFLTIIVITSFYVFPVRAADSDNDQSNEEFILPYYTPCKCIDGVPKCGNCPPGQEFNCFYEDGVLCLPINSDRAFCLEKPSDTRYSIVRCVPKKT